SQFIEEGGPIPTTFSFEEDGFTLIGGVTESPKAISAFDPNFNMQIAWHKDQVKFSQKIKLAKPLLTVKGILEFMTCDDTNCLPPEEVPFTIQVDARAAVSATERTVLNSEVAAPSDLQDSSDLSDVATAAQVDSGLYEEKLS